MALAAGLVSVSGCGADSGQRASTQRTTPGAHPPAFSATERAEIARRRARERPHFSGAALALRLAGLPAHRARAELLRVLGRSVLRDARSRARRHQLDGPFRGVDCSVARDDREYARAHPDAPVLRYECLAYNRRAATNPPVILGTPYLARVDFSAHRYAWCLFTPVGGEGTHTAVTFAVQPAAACAKPPV